MAATKKSRTNKSNVTAGQEQRRGPGRPAGSSNRGGGTGATSQRGGNMISDSLVGLRHTGTYEFRITK